jgi:hypothetical protein
MVHVNINIEILWFFNGLPSFILQNGVLGCGEMSYEKQTSNIIWISHHFCDLFLLSKIEKRGRHTFMLRR